VNPKQSQAKNNFRDSGESSGLLFSSKLREKSLKIFQLHLAWMEMAKMAEKPKAKSSKNDADKRSKFVELAENRTRNAIKSIRVIGKLGNKNAYQFDDSDVQKIVKALSKEIDQLRARLGQNTAKDTVDFSL